MGGSFFYNFFLLHVTIKRKLNKLWSTTDLTNLSINMAANRPPSLMDYLKNQMKWLPSSKSPRCLFIILIISTLFIINGDARTVILSANDSPIKITSDLIVSSDSTLVIEAGAEIHFAPRTGIQVHGALVARGTPARKIILTTAEHTKDRPKPILPDVRLVDGDVPWEGRLQVLYNAQWYSVCTLSRNWTKQDLNVVCSQLGYDRAEELYQWFPRVNQTLQLALKKPSCGGHEISLFHCPAWHDRHVGSGTCDYHPDIGIRCSRKLSSLLSAPQVYWSGIEFISDQYAISGTGLHTGPGRQESVLEHVEITYAGQDQAGNTTSAIRILGGTAPKMSNLQVRWSSGSGLNVSSLNNGPISIEHSFFEENSGYGIFINSSLGGVHLQNVHVAGNMADGLRYVHTYEPFLVSKEDFCSSAQLGRARVYPLRLTYSQTNFQKTDVLCCRFFEADPGGEVTVHFPLLRSWHPRPEDESRSTQPIIYVYDGYSNELMAQLTVRNDTLAQSVNSLKGRLKVCHKPALYRQVMFTVDITTSKNGREYDLVLNASSLITNNGRGLWAQNTRSGVMINNSLISDNTYIAGVHIQNGGEFILNNSIITKNWGDGVNISSAGGYKHIHKSQILNNSLHGLAFHFNASNHLVAFNFTHHVTHSHISGNGQFGLHIGNQCLADSFWNISTNHFDLSIDDAIRIQSCIPDYDNQLVKAPNCTRVEVGHNHFNRNRRHSLFVSPVLNMHLLVEHNLFEYHATGVLYLNNREHWNRNYKSILLPPSLYTRTDISDALLVQYNRFYHNVGSYVASLGLPMASGLPISGKFHENMLEQNIINEPFPGLVPRSRSAAVVCISSSNILVTRNRLHNPESAFELAAHLESHQNNINASLNYWGYGSGNASGVYERIFDRKNRYNLARVEFLQYLTRPQDLDSLDAISYEREVDKIMSFRSRSIGTGSMIGGEVTGEEILEAGREFHVYRDIFVRPNSRLIIQQGAILRFEQGIGMMIQGNLEVRGVPQKGQVLFTSTTSSPSQSILGREFPDLSQQLNTVSALPTRHNDPHDSIIFIKTNTTDVVSPIAAETNPNDTHPLPPIPSVNAGSQGEDILPRSKRDLSKNVRLSRSTEGWLQARVDGQWGSVCSYEFDEVDAAIACQQLGLVLNRKQDWYMATRLTTGRVALTGLHCSPLDTDITSCRRERNFEHSCLSEVAIRCSQPSWSGVRIGIMSEYSQLDNLVLERAGMFDYSTHEFRSGLQIDFNRHRFNNLQINDNLFSGMEVMWNEVFKPRTVTNSIFQGNARDGFVSRSQGLVLSRCTLRGNERAGFRYNPTFDESEQTDLHRWIQPAVDPEKFFYLKSGDFQQKDRFFIPPEERNFWFLIIPEIMLGVSEESQVDSDREIHKIIETSKGTSIGIMVLAPPMPGSTERVVIRRGDLNSGHEGWDLHRNLTAFPILNFGYKLTISYRPGLRPRGGIILYFTTKSLPFGPLPPEVVHELATLEMKRLTLEDSLVRENGLGIFTSHFNRESSLTLHDNSVHGPRLEQFHRYNNETILIRGNRIEKNNGHILLVSSPLYEPIEESITEVNYTLIGNYMSDNVKGIQQVSRDMASANNLFHWSLNDSVITGTRTGGIQLTFPYVWGYNENRTHSLEMWNNTLGGNTDFCILVDGHFAKLNISHNRFEHNQMASYNSRAGLISSCSSTSALLTVKGMEKEMRISRNQFYGNIATSMIHFGATSQAHKLGHVRAEFTGNSLLGNTPGANASVDTISSSIHVSGTQLLNITRNLFNNPALRYEVHSRMAAIESLDYKLNLVENWWGTVQPILVRDRIFDFNFNNDQPEASYAPVLTMESINAGTLNIDDANYADRDPPSPWTLSGIRDGTLPMRTLGGKLTKKMILKRRSEPYMVASDLTIMPTGELHIEEGTILEFLPQVGMLVLGDLVAAGREHSPIIMRPAPPFASGYHSLSPGNIPKSRWRRELSDEDHPTRWSDVVFDMLKPNGLGSVRLSINETTHTSAGNKMNDGFLEIYNTTSFEWVPVCDPSFTERSARVVCKQLGFQSRDVVLKLGSRLDLFYTAALLNRVRSWPPALECTGSETALHECPLRLSTYANQSEHACFHDGSTFVYINCNSTPKTLPSWGGVRFALHTYDDYYEPGNMIGSISLPESSNNKKSRLEHVHILGAGSLHGLRAAAVQLVRRDVILDHVSIADSEYHGLEVIGCTSSLSINKADISYNLGLGINFLALSRASSDTRDLSYEPLPGLPNQHGSDLPNSAYGMLNICAPGKDILLENRLLLYYKYQAYPSDCIKTFVTRYMAKRIGFRLLSFNLHNSTQQLTMAPDSLTLWDGHVTNLTAPIIVSLDASSPQTGHRSAEKKFYSSSYGSFSVGLHASAAGEEYGFVAEVIALPVTYHVTRGEVYHNITYCQLTDNKLGGLVYRSAGEATPTLSFHHNIFESNGQSLYGNFTTSDAAVFLQLQNTQHLYFHNNHLIKNQGGFTLWAGSLTSVSSLKAFVSNNLIEHNFNKPAVSLIGRAGGSYQTVEMSHNYISSNSAPYEDTVMISQIVALLQKNIITGNTARRQLTVEGTFQEFKSNSIYNNIAREWDWKRTTILARDAGQKYNANYLVNPENDFEIEAGNRTLPAIGNSRSGQLNFPPLPASPIYASHNWWGYNETAAVAARIRDMYDSLELLPIEFEPYITTAMGTTEEMCSGGWRRLGDTCLIYIGASLGYQDAKRFCELQNSSMPFVRSNGIQEELLTNFLYAEQVLYDRRYGRVWVQSFDISPGDCVVLSNARVRRTPCDNKLPFLCERNAEIRVILAEWYREPLGIAALALSSLTALLTLICFSCWIAKSRQKYSEKLVRRNSIRSLRSFSQSVNPYSSTNTLNSTQYLIRGQGIGRVPAGSSMGAGSVIPPTPTPTFGFPMRDGHIPAGLRSMELPTHRTSYAEATQDLTYENRAFSGTAGSRTDSSSIDSVPLPTTLAGGAQRPFSSMYSEPLETCDAQTLPASGSVPSIVAAAGPSGITAVTDTGTNSMGSISRYDDNIPIVPSNHPLAPALATSTIPESPGTTSRQYATIRSTLQRASDLQQESKSQPHSQPLRIPAPDGMSIASNATLGTIGTAGSLFAPPYMGISPGRTSFTSQVLLTFRQKQAQRAAEAAAAAAQESARMQAQTSAMARGVPSRVIHKPDFAPPPVPTVGPRSSGPRNGSALAMTQARLLETSLDELSDITDRDRDRAMSEASFDSYKSKPLETAM